MLRADFRFAASDVHFAARVVPCGDAMSPPELAAYAPILDVAHPLEVGPGPALRHEARATLLHRADRWRRKRCDPHVPLIGQIGLEHRTTAIAAWHDQAVLLDAFDEPAGFELRDHSLASLHTIESAKPLGHVVVQRGTGGQDVDLRQSVALSH